ncbi:hypothetical protein MBLNU457_1818t1 [Dothideomycetes sp. NU457]
MTNIESHLLSLPRELRDEIFRYLLIGDTQVKLPVTTSDPELAYLRLLREIKLSTRLETSPQLVCHQLRSEYLETFSRITSVRVVVRVFSIDTNLFHGVRKHLPAQIRANIQQCSVFIIWKPRWGSELRTVPTLQTSLEHLHEALPALTTLDVEHRYFDVGDLEDDLHGSHLDLDEFYSIPERLHTTNTKLTLSATTTLLSQDEKYFLEPMGDLEYLLKAECYVIWQFIRSSEPSAWNGLFPRAGSFFCYGEERETMEQLEKAVRHKYRTVN